MSFPRRNITLFLIGAAVVIALLAGLSLPEIKGAASPGDTTANYIIYWDVVASGGPPLTSSHYVMHSTTGQPAIGTLSSAHYTLHSGYWYNNLYMYIPSIYK
jgi:hypothetical protein